MGGPVDALEQRAECAIERRARQIAADFGNSRSHARFQAAIELGLSDGDVIELDETGNEIADDPRVRQVVAEAGVSTWLARCIVAAERGLI